MSILTERVGSSAVGSEEGGTSGLVVHSWCGWLALFVPVCAYLLLALQAYPFMLDDAFISFRYAVNLAEGQGLVFNAGERVEGYSNPLWVGLMAVSHALGLEVTHAARLLGLLTGVAMLLMLGRIAARHFNFAPGMVFAMQLYLAMNISLIYYATSGMESILYAGMILLMHLLLLEKRQVMAAVVCALVVLLRPEGILFILPLALGVSLDVNIRQALKITLIPLGGFFAWLAFRWLYYGDLLPNTHTVKAPDIALTAEWFVESLRAFVAYTLDGATVEMWLLLLAAFGFFALLDLKTLPMGLSLICAGFFVWYSQNDWMSFWRFYLPVLSLIVLFAYAAMDRIRSAAVVGFQRTLICGLAVLLVLPGLHRALGAIGQLDAQQGINPAMYSTPHREIGEYLARHSESGDVIVVNEIGAIGYYSGRRIVDMLGLIDPDILPLLRGDDLDAYADYVLAQNPTHILLNDKQHRGDPAMHPVHASVYRKMEQTGQFEAGPVFPLNEHKNLLLFVRRDRVLEP